MHRYSINILIFQFVFVFSYIIYTLSSIIILPIGVATYLLIFLFYCIKFIFRKPVFFYKINWLDWAVFLFIIINLISILNVLLLNYSIEVYIKGISYCLFPIVGYFIFSFSIFFEDNKLNNFLSVFLVTTLLSIIIGIYFFVYQPPFYVNYILKSYEGLISENDDLFQLRLLSYYSDPTLVGNISAVSLPIFYYLKDNGMKQLQSRTVRIIVPFIIISGVILSFARSAWLATFVIVIIYNIKDSLLKSLKFIFSISLFILLILYAFIFLIDNTLSDLLTERGANLFTSFSERSWQTEWALDVFSNNPFGIGLGQAGHKSFTGGSYKGVYDNNYLRILVELGIQGALSFLLILVLSLTSTIQGYMKGVNRSFHFLITSILFIYFFQSIGSNIIDLHYSSFIFWSFMGILSLMSKRKFTFSNY